MQKVSTLLVHALIPPIKEELAEEICLEHIDREHDHGALLAAFTNLPRHLVVLPSSSKSSTDCNSSSDFSSGQSASSSALSSIAVSPEHTFSSVAASSPVITTETDCVRKLESLNSPAGIDAVSSLSASSNSESKDCDARSVRSGSNRNLLGNVARLNEAVAFLQASIGRLEQEQNRFEESLTRTKTCMRRDVLKLSAVLDVAAPDLMAADINSNANPSDYDAVHCPNLLCAMCQSFQSQLQACSRCRRIRYCNSHCQKHHWPEHKLVCEEPESNED